MVWNGELRRHSLAKKGWHGERLRHSNSRKGIRTKQLKSHLKPRKFEIVVDYGKPYAEYADNVQDLQIILQKLKNIYESDPESHPYFDIWVYENDLDITSLIDFDSGTIIGEYPEKLKPHFAKGVSEPHLYHNRSFTGSYMKNGKDCMCTACRNARKKALQDSIDSDPAIPSYLK